ncbi:hypothetical protein [Phenylobacterium sp. J367]|uniref:hypothetical protein n=1 Tax=Phenylobacterium sp. J367 TaxID=2898435 RepID=UPI002150939F|nr:hypothetical protein [Phenylobacterium sp. J367]MCR5878691.1 hypothetical protein [Phenylobacterium sp. J367]
MTVASSAVAPGLAPLPVILKAGLLGGLVDFIYACGVAAANGRPATRPWQSVASGWLGKPSFDMGWTSVALGVVTHFAIATTMALAFALAASRVAVLTRRPLVSGLAYGVVLYLVMYGVVLPGRFGAPFPNWQGIQTVADICAHLGVGVVIALVIARVRLSRAQD